MGSIPMPDFSQMDDPTLISSRAELREALEYDPKNLKLQARYAAITREFLDRAAIAWQSWHAQVS